MKRNLAALVLISAISYSEYAKAVRINKASDDEWKSLLENAEGDNLFNYDSYNEDNPKGYTDIVDSVMAQNE